MVTLNFGFRNKDMPTLFIVIIGLLYNTHIKLVIILVMS